MKKIDIKKNDRWPEAVSDGLTLSCGVCGVVPVVDYTVSAEAWKNTVPKELKLGVVCLNCLIDMDPNVLTSLEHLFVCGGGRTVSLAPTIIYDYRERKDKMKNFLIVVAYSQTDQLTVLVKDCKDMKEAERRTKKAYPNAAQYWVEGEVSAILEK